MAKTTLLDTMHHAAKAWCIFACYHSAAVDSGTKRTKGGYFLTYDRYLSVMSVLKGVHRMTQEEAAAETQYQLARSVYIGLCGDRVITNIQFTPLREGRHLLARLPPGR